MTLKTIVLLTTLLPFFMQPAKIQFTDITASAGITFQACSISVIVEED